MPFVEQWIYGSGEAGRGAPRTVLAQSAGLGTAAAGELKRLVDSWGDLPVGGLERAALVALPLQAGVPGLRGRAWALLRFAPGDSDLVHAVALADAEFTAWGRDPFALAANLRFMDHWRGAAPERQALPEAPALPAVSPPPGPGDVALVTEAIRHILTRGRLLLPLAQPTPASDRALALILAALPAALQREMRFASWTGKDAGSWSVAALGTPDCAFSGWQRLLLAEVAVIIPEAVEAYAREVGARLTAGDLPGLVRLSREQATVPGTGPRPAAPGPRPAERVAERSADRILARPAAAAPSPAPTRTPAPEPGGGVHPARRGRPGQRIPFETGPAGDTPAGRPAGPARTRLLRPGRAGDLPFSARPQGRRVLPLVAVGLALAAVAWWQTPRLAALAGDRFGWFADRTAPAADLAPSLLRVVDVGAVYDRIIQPVARAGLDGRAAGTETVRRRAQLDFQGEAAGPLLQQVDLFADLAAEGIQQAGRPDREIERLQALEAQGNVLEQEMRRLEVAWYALANGTDWRDVARLDDAAVAARRDSLKAVAAQALAEASRDVGTAPAWGRMRSARSQMHGMAGLLTGFEASRWSQAWEDDLYAAAETVSPSASSATRAYRNAAFALVRLKRAERSAEAVELPYADGFGDGSWPTAAVADVLTDLRRQAARFEGGAAPPLVTATLALYDALGRAGSLAAGPDAAAALAELDRNAAVAFDARYGDYLARLRYEAVTAAAAADGNADGTGLAGLADAAGVQAAARFAAARSLVPDETAWRAEAEAQRDPFMVRWAGRQADAAAAGRTLRLEAFDARWQPCTGLAAAVDAQAAQGRDWTAAWCDLREQVAALVDDYALAAGGDAELAARVTRAARLLRTMDAPRVLRLDGVTVRVGPDVPLSAQEVSVELAGAGAPVVSPPIRLGPSAPAGSGSVGTVSLDWNVPIDPAATLVVRVRDTQGRELMQAQVPSLRERAGPGALVRPRGEGPVTVSFRLDPAWWRGTGLGAIAGGM
ncbi:MAG TPA: hypothetical protein PLQ13_10780 [Candidatus Krumholzibacteria bacterium]|nr:hypothetical protein [Candidatus Krumholzibacteria bacterium]